VKPSEQDFIADALPAFISEAREQVETIEQLMLQLEDAPKDRELLDALFRCAHTVKGSAGIFGLDAVVGFTHHVETLLDRLREGQIALNPELSTLLLQCNDQIRSLVAAALDPQVEADQALAARAMLVDRLQAASGSANRPSNDANPAVPAAAMAPRQAGTWQVSVQFGLDTFRNGMDPLALLGYLAGIGEISSLHCDLAALPAIDSLDAESCHLGFDFSLITDAAQAEIEAAFSFVREDCVLRLAGGDLVVDEAQPMPASPAHGDAEPPTLPTAMPPAGPPVGPPNTDPSLDAKPARQRQSAADDHRFIRVHADRLDAVINLLGELVIAGAGAQLLARQTRQRTLIEANTQIGRLIEEIRNGTLQLRMVPIGETFSRLRRVVRDTASDLGKEVTLEIQGGETELDKSVVERIADPLMHLVRNALDHGLETPAQRLASGKAAQGRLTLSACHESGSILIRIGDDGRGINRDKVLQRAWDSGLVERGSQPADAEIVKLIFEPGFSTASEVTKLSGRGVGMDVVRRNIEALRGTVTVTSDPGQGAQIEIRMPLTLAIIDGFLVGVGASKFVFPLDAVVEVIERGPAAMGSPHGRDDGPDLRGRGVVELRGQVLPVLDLRRLYGLDSPEPERSSVVVIRAGSSRYGVIVDQLLGQHQTVIKPLGRMLSSLRGMSGSSILGNGEVALIFDVVSLSQLASQQPATPTESSNSPKRQTAIHHPSLEGQA
jgi:two-component system chemotaxis sensor kinase CheA